MLMEVVLNDIGLCRHRMTIKNFVWHQEIMGCIPVKLGRARNKTDARQFLSQYADAAKKMADARYTRNHVQLTSVTVKRVPRLVLIPPLHSVFLPRQGYSQREP